MPTDIEIDLFLKKLLKACGSEEGVVVESYAVRRADADMGWGIPEIKGFPCGCSCPFMKTSATCGSNSFPSTT